MAKQSYWLSSLAGCFMEAAPIRVLIHAVSSLLDRAIFRVIVNGIDSAIPTGPRTHPQNIRDKKTTRVERPRPRPIKRGSMTFPIITLNEIYPTAASTAVVVPSWMNAIRIAGTAAIIDPIFGT